MAGPATRCDRDQVVGNAAIRPEQSDARSLQTNPRRTVGVRTVHRLTECRLGPRIVEQGVACQTRDNTEVDRPCLFLAVHDRIDSTLIGTNNAMARMYGLSGRAAFTLPQWRIAASHLPEASKKLYTLLPSPTTAKTAVPTRRTYALPRRLDESAGA